MYDPHSQPMSLDAFVSVVLLATVVGVLLALLIMAFEDNKMGALYRRLHCRVGKHRFNRLRCADCKKRRHTNLRVIDGGAKGKTGSDFKF